MSNPPNRARTQDQSVTGLARQHLLPTLTVGFVNGVLEVALAISFAALIFAGPLAVFVPQGIGVALAGAVVGCAVITLFTATPGIIGGNQDVPAAVLAVMAAGISGALPGATPQTFITIVATIILSSLVTGLFFWLTGRFEMGGLVRFLPHPVVGGFLAGTGWLLLAGGVELMHGPATLAPGAQLLRWLPGLLLGLLLYLVLERTDHHLVLPSLLLGAAVLFFITAVLSGQTPAALLASGWLLGPFPATALWPPVSLDDLALIDWSLLLRQVPAIAILTLVSAVSLLLNATGIELATQHDLDLNKELRVAGLANGLSALAGGLPGYQQLSFSVLNFELKVNNRLTGLVSVLVCLVALLAGAAVLAYIPEMIAGALLVYLGFSFLVPWVVTGWRTLPRIDYAIVLTILLVTAMVGFMQAVGVGLLLAIVLFVVSYSQIDVVRHELSAQTYQSRVTRPPQQEAQLRAAGERLLILQLQGFIFFGTANQLLNRLRVRVNDAALPPLETVILDLERVTGMDSTAEISFRNMVQLAQRQRFRILFAGAEEKVRWQLAQAGRELAESERVLYAPSLDRGMSFWEEDLLASTAVTDNAAPAPWAMALPPGMSMDRLLSYFEKLEMEAGTHVMRAGAAGDALYLLAEGQVTAQIERPDRPPLRLQTVHNGRLIGELGFYLGQPRSVDVVADTPVTLYRLDRAGLAQMEREDPASASALHRLLIMHLGERVSNLSRTVNALER